MLRKELIFKKVIEPLVKDRQGDKRSWEKTTGPGNRLETLPHRAEGPESFNCPEMPEVPELGKKG